MLYLPGQNWSTVPVAARETQLPVAARDTINASAAYSTARETQLTIAAENAALRVIYGQVRVGPQIANVLSYAGNLVILAVWAQGECDSFVDLQMDDKPLPAGVTYTHYLGTAGQTVNATLAAAFAAQSPSVSFADAMPGICYSVITVPPGAATGFPRLNATIKGRKVWTGASTVWSDNPSWCLADFITNANYGMGRACDYPSAASVAADCDVLAGGTENLRTLNLALETVQPSVSWLDTLRTYAGCWVVQSAAGLKLVGDKPATSAASFAHTAGTILSIADVKKRGVQSTPTVMTVQYTDTTLLPHRSAEATVYAPGVLAGTTPRRESSISLPGVNRYSQAYREATERLNKLLLNDLSCTLGVFDEALALEVGDVVDVSHPIGLSAKLMRVMAVDGSYGRYTLNLVEYDPAVYSAAVATAPTWADTNLPNPAAPPAITGVVMTEEVFQLENGIWSSRWRITWDAVAYAFLANYRAELWDGSVLVQASNPSGPVWATSAVKEGVPYTANIYAVTTIGAVGAAGTQAATPLGKFLIPSDVPSVSAFEAGGTVYVSWSPSIDIDIWKYEVRYGVAGWDSAAVVDRLEALRLTTVQIPVGTWTIYVKAIDSVQQYSTNPATCSVTVTSDANSFLVDAKDQTAPTLTNMAEYSLARADASRYFVSEDGVAFGTKYSSNLATYSNPLATYHTSMTSTWQGESEDFGLLLGGQWTGTATVQAVSGSLISYIGYGAASITAFIAGLSQKLNARFACLKHEALTTSTLLVTIPDQTIRVDAIPREELGSGTSSAAGPLTITLANEYVAVKKLTITPQGTTARSATYDNVILGSPSSFDVYVFNELGVKIASPFTYQFQGV